MRRLMLAVALLTVPCAAAGHLPGAHDDVAAASCDDATIHLCAIVVEDDRGECFVCRIGLGGLAVDRPAFACMPGATASTPARPGAGPAPGRVHDPSSPRAPPMA